MARGDVRIAVTLACEDCKRRNYQTNKSRRNSPDRIELRVVRRESHGVAAVRLHHTEGKARDGGGDDGGEKDDPARNHS